ncbi:flavoprotein [Actinomycetospora succinea]|uniref:flavoprotein n=1 Tax=Actinomycetospora succinea TaxID=663603 RepID=UPI00105FDDF9|nr:flavoprotein [Actinomycetospora succinea]
MSSPLGLVVCGAPLAARADEVARALVGAGWSVSAGVTESGSEWIDADTLSKASEAPASTRRRQPDEQRRESRPDHVVAFPLTFNTANKIARGVMDNHVTGTLCDALGTGATIVSVLFVNDRLWAHPAWASTLDTLTSAGVMFLDPHSGRLGPPVPVRSGTGGDVVAGFDPEWVVRALESRRAATA